MRLRLLLIAASCLLAAALLWLQSPFDAGEFDFGNYRLREGTIHVRPFPILVTPDQTFPLVARGKHGVLSPHDGSRVSLAGAAIHRDGITMLEVLEGSERFIGPGQNGQISVDRGHASLSGEIVDSKCFLGVMKPGRGRVHRECAYRCISGGIPPLFTVVDERGDRKHFWLTAAGGASVDKRTILPLVGRSVRLEGQLFDRNGLRYLEVDFTRTGRE